MFQPFLRGAGLGEPVELLAGPGQGLFVQRRQRFQQDLRQAPLVDPVPDVGGAQRVQQLQQAVEAVPAGVAVQPEHQRADAFPVGVSASR